METTSESSIAQYLSFFVAGEEYGIGILRVKEIIEWGTVTRVPGAPPSIRGVINLRGGVVPVVDLAVKLGLAPSEVSKRSCVVVVEIDLEGKRTVMGIMADAVSQLLELSTKDIEPPPQFGTRMQVEYLLGMGRAGEKFALLLDVDRVLTTSELLAASNLQSTGDSRDEAETTPHAPASSDPALAAPAEPDVGTASAGVTEQRRRGRKKGSSDSEKGSAAKDDSQRSEE